MSVDGASSDGTGPSRPRGRPWWVEVLVVLLVAVLVAVAVQGFVARIFIVPTGSMEPTLHGCPGCTNDRVAVDRVSYHFAAPEPGHIVVFRGPSAWSRNSEASGARPRDTVARLLHDASAYTSLAAPDERAFVKRVVAVEGQVVACCDAGRLTVDGLALPEPYLPRPPGPRMPASAVPIPPTRIGPGQLWVMGDNREESLDSRSFGPVPVTDVIGRVRAIVLPVPRVSVLATGEADRRPPVSE